ncbi:MAG: enoyl-CoA hydratase-related protein [Chitinophagales bacterium]
MAENILLEKKNGVAKIVLNRPDKLNAFNRSMAQGLQQHLKDADEDETIRCILLTGSGRAFSSGQDLGEFPGGELPDFEKVIEEYYNPLIRLLRTVRKPVLCAVNGIAAGAGANIALSCDIVVATTSASFVQAFSKIGLIPDCGGTYFLPRLIGLQKASAFMMLGDKIGAAEAERIGMIYKCFEDAVFEESAVQIAGTLARLPTKTLMLTRHALMQSPTNTLDQQLDLEKKLQDRAGHTDDFKEGITAFFEKRLPLFKGK